MRPQGVVKSDAASPLSLYPLPGSEPRNSAKTTKPICRFQVGAVHAVGCGRSRKVMVGPDRVPASANSLVYDDRDPHPCGDARTAALRSTATGHSAP